MNEEETALIEKFKRLSPGSRRIALVQITAAAECEENARQYDAVRIRTGSGGQPEGIPDLGVRLT